MAPCMNYDWLGASVLKFFCFLLSIDTGKLMDSLGLLTLVFCSHEGEIISEEAMRVLQNG